MNMTTQMLGEYHCCHPLKFEWMNSTKSSITLLSGKRSQRINIDPHKFAGKSYNVKLVMIVLTCTLQMPSHHEVSPTGRATSELAQTFLAEL